jgi:hypothetical protein
MKNLILLFLILLIFCSGSGVKEDKENRIIPEKQDKVLSVEDDQFLIDIIGNETEQKHIIQEVQSFNQIYKLLKRNDIPGFDTVFTCFHASDTVEFIRPDNNIFIQKMDISSANVFLTKDKIGVGMDRTILRDHFSSFTDEYNVLEIRSFDFSTYLTFYFSQGKIFRFTFISSFSD